MGQRWLEQIFEFVAFGRGGWFFWGSWGRFIGGEMFLQSEAFGCGVDKCEEESGDEPLFEEGCSEEGGREEPDSPPPGRVGGQSGGDGYAGQGYGGKRPEHGCGDSGDESAMQDLPSVSEVFGHCSEFYLAPSASEDGDVAGFPAVVGVELPAFFLELGEDALEKLGSSGAFDGVIGGLGAFEAEPGEVGQGSPAESGGAG